MTVRAILDSKGHHIESVEPDARLTAAIKILAERKIGDVLVMSKDVRSLITVWQADASNPTLVIWSPLGFRWSTS